MSSVSDIKLIRTDFFFFLKYILIVISNTVTFTIYSVSSGDTMTHPVYNVQLFDISGY